METQSKIIKTEIQGLDANTLLSRFEKIQNGILELQKAVQPQPETELLTRQTVAEWLSISLPTLHAWTKNGILKSYRIGNKIRYKKNEVLTALQTIKHS
ncbi:helix-turn-helix domain-containing protein [Tamlana sp. 62-3]|uniref:Helix-turn-helix domain-containing protein n=1 Tax=Neotamlana sargassicola TaxID=2883125 RepID=A0A9X1I3A8_9FLAO|nr:helix-turn-helix domain-containing protein [Tamlana sargassicola]MCB4807135.1 helix-turn-helix domain-containing protein [Tamlana sargassicola]